MKGREVVNDTRPRSALHVEARRILKARFPTLQILEEVPISVVRGKTLYLDFYIPLRKICVEVHGQQHFKFNTKFHSTRADFLKQRKNDTNKEEWCEINGIQHIVFAYDEQESWEELV